MKLIDLTGRRFGRLVVIRRSDTSPKHWVCRCDCGDEGDRFGPGLRGGKTVSCGCLRAARIGNLRRKHGKSDSRAYKVWQDMRRRCRDPRRKAYKHYGGRGIAVCARWQSFADFLADMGEPGDGMSLDRIDVNGNYEPGNCRWVTLADQKRNKRTTVFTEWRGRRVAMSVVAAETGLPYESIRYHVRRGMTGDDAAAYVAAHRVMRLSAPRSSAAKAPSL